MNKNNYKICVIGIGKHAFFNIIPSLKRKNYNIVGLVSRTPKLFNRNFRRSTNLSTAIKNNPENTLYLVTTPPKTHYPIIIKLLNNNKNVLVEKPLTISQEQVDKINKLTLNKKLYYEMFMYKFTSCYLKTINFCKQNYPEIDKIELTFLLPSYPKNTFRDNTLLEDSCLFDIGSYVFNFSMELGNKIKNLKLISCSFKQNLLTRIIFGFEISSLNIIAEIGLGIKYKNSIKIIKKDKSDVVFDKIFYGKSSKKYIKHSNSLNNISYIDHNGFDSMFNKLNFKKIVKHKLVDYIKLKEIYKQMGYLKKQIENY